MIKKPIQLVLILLCTSFLLGWNSPELRAEEFKWTNIGPGGAIVYSFLAVPNNEVPAVVYAGTGGGIYRSSDNGSTWTLLTDPMVNRAVTWSLALGGSEIFAATSRGVFKRSLNAPNEAGWTDISGQILKNKGGAYSLTVVEDTIYLGTYGQGIFKKEKDAAKDADWTPFNDNILQYKIVKTIVAVGDHLVVGTSSQSADKAWSNGVYRRPLDGPNDQAWQGVKGGWGTPEVNKLLLVKDHLYATTNHGVYKRGINLSEDWGSIGEWGQISPKNANGSGIFDDLYGKNIDDIIVVGNYLYVSAVGHTEFTIGNFFFESGPDGVYRRSLNPAQPDEKWQNVSGTAFTKDWIDSLLLVGNNLFTGGLKGIYHQIAGNEDWSVINQGIKGQCALSLLQDPSSGFLLAGLYYGGVWQRNNENGAWVDLSSNLETGKKTIRTMLATGNHLYIGGDVTGVLRRPLNSPPDTQWEQIGDNTNNLYGADVRAMAASGNQIYVGLNGGNDEGVRRYNTANSTLEDVSNNLAGKRVSGLTILGNNVYASAYTVVSGSVVSGSVGVFRRPLDAAAKQVWDNITNNLPISDFYNINLMTTIGDKIYVGTEGAGIFRRNKEDTGWEDINGPTLGSGRINEIILSGGYLYAAVETGDIKKPLDGVFRKPIDAAPEAEWQDISGNLQQGGRVFSLASIGNKIYAGTCGASISRLSIPSPLCGNKTLDPGEGCDDGNQQDGDGCAMDCEKEDLDGDGHFPTSSGGDDCNDNDPTINPQQSDINCNGVDNNCDGKIDNIPDDETSCSTNLLGICNPGHLECASGVLKCVVLIQPGQKQEVCNNQDDDCDGPTDEEALDIKTFYLDGDNDGYGGSTSEVACSPSYKYVSKGGDCDDSKHEVSPAATEVCNGYDDNCNGVVDSDTVDYDTPCTTTHPGVCSVGKMLCGIGSQSVQCTATIKPGEKPESCGNSIDDDCDGSKDEEEDSVGKSTFYLDADGDGFGDKSAVPGLFCKNPSVPGKKYATNNSDCNDGNATINPNGEEICNEGLDDDCDGKADDQADYAEGKTIFYLDNDKDGYGAGGPFGFCKDPSTEAVKYATNNGDFNDDCATCYPGAAELCDGIDSNGNGDLDDGVPGVGEACTTPLPGICASGHTACAGTQGIQCNPDVKVGEKPEACNETDDDCDGTIDNGVKTTFYQDTDQDGYGTPADSTQACSTPAGYVDNQNDCNDACKTCFNNATDVCDGKDNNCSAPTDDQDPQSGQTCATGLPDKCAAGKLSCTNPGTDQASLQCIPDLINYLELCNQQDDDCDQLIDDQDPNVVDQPTWFLDADKDNFGDATADPANPNDLASKKVIIQCNNPTVVEAGKIVTKYVKNNSDCNDTDASINPNGEEVCGNGKDDDCNGEVDDGC